MHYRSTTTLLSATTLNRVDLLGKTELSEERGLFVVGLELKIHYTERAVIGRKIAM